MFSICRAASLANAKGITIAVNGKFQFTINGLTPTMNDYRFRWQPLEGQWYFIQVTYGPLHNRSVAHPFLLAAFHSKFIGEQ